jgi:outer membrane lipoprotein-sorting protein
VSGSIATHVDLGLPSLPDEGPAATGGIAQLFSSVSGDHRVRLWMSRDGLRVAELLPFSELSFVASRTDAWAWDSSAFTAYHLGPYPRVTDRAGSGHGDALGPAHLLDPMDLARRSLLALSPTTRVFVGGTARVAGRAAYVLVVEPRTSATLVGRIEVSIDAQLHVPLRVAVFARGAGGPALSAGFTAVGFDPIPPGTFRFSPPDGAKVVRAPAVLRGSAHSVPINPSAREAGESPDEYYRAFGSGWAAVFALRTPPIQSSARAGGLDLRSLLPYSGPLLSIRLIERGDHDWLVYGLVAQRRLVGVAANLP